jgi:rhodanese-related sulfurtransferase
MSGQEINEVSVTEVPEGAHILDVREPHEWEAGHVDGAQHIPLGQVGERAAEVPAGPVFIICKLGGRSAQATKILSDAGKQVTNVAGGMTAWAGAGKPMVSDTGQPPYVFT